MQPIATWLADTDCAHAATDPTASPACASPGRALPERPLALVPFVERDKRAVFELGLHEYVVEADLDVVRRVIARCDGRTEICEILSREPVASRPHAEEILCTLAATSLLVDASDGYERFHQLSSNWVDDGISAVCPRPRLFGPSIPDRVRLRAPDSGCALSRLARRRQSASPGQAHSRLTAVRLVTILDTMYGGGSDDPRPVPSAGASWPLVIHAVIVGVDDLTPGIWAFEPGTHELIGPVAAVPDPRHVLLRDHALDAMLDEADGALIVISVPFDSIGEHYGQRGYRYAHLEAGAVMQMCYLSAVDQGCRVRALGGFVDDRLAAALPSDCRLTPLIALLVQ